MGNHLGGKIINRKQQSKLFSLPKRIFDQQLTSDQIKSFNCSVAQSPTSPVNHWQEGKLGSGMEEGGEEGWKEWEEKENCTGTLDSICTEGSLEEPRYAKVVSILTPHCGSL